MKTVINRLLCFSSALLLFLWFHLGTRMGEFAKDPGVGWHLASGEWVLDHGAVPVNDPFLAYSPPLPWVSDQWAADAIFAAIFRFSGWVGLYNFSFFLFLAAFLLIVYPTIRYRSGSTLTAIVAVIFCSKPAEIHFILRPVLFGFFFMALLGRLLPQICRSGEVSNRRILTLTFLLFLFWANLHPSFAYGFVLVIAYVGAILVWDWLIERKKEEWTRRLGVIIAALGGSLCNPYGWRLHESIITLGASRLFMRLHQEWMPLDILEPEGFFFVLFAVIILIATWIRASRGERVLAEGVAESVILALTARAGFAHIRMIPYFFIFAAPLFGTSLLVVAKAIGNALSDRLPGLEERFRARERFEAARASPALIALLLLAVCVLGTPFGRVAGFPTTRADDEVLVDGGREVAGRRLNIPLGPPAAQYPYLGLDYLKSVERTVRVSSMREGKPIVVVNPPDWGGFITLYGGGRIRPLFDDRNTLLGESRYLSYFRIANDCTALLQLARELGADFLMIPAWELKMDGCIVSDPENREVSPKEGRDRCEGIEPCFGQPVAVQRPNYRDSVAAIFRVPLPPAQSKVG